MKFKPNKEKLINLILLLVVCLYLTVVPALITDYGLTHNKTNWGFNVYGPTPFYEAYSVFTMLFWLLHLLVIMVIGGVYWLIKELFFENDDEAQRGDNQ